MRATFLCSVAYAMVILAVTLSPRQVSGFNSVDELKKVIKNTINVLLDPIRPVGGDLFRAQAMFAGVNVALQFNWPIGTKGTVRLQPNQLYAIPDFKVFTEQVGSQLGKKVSLPLLGNAGIGNNGFALVALEFKLEGMSLDRVHVKFNIPGWDVLSAYYLKILRPQVVMTIYAKSPIAYSIKAVGDVVGIVSAKSIQVLHVEISLPKDEVESVKVVVRSMSSIIPFEYLQKFITISQGLKLPGIAAKVFHNVVVKHLEIVFEPGMTRISNFTLEAVLADPWKIGMVSLDNARLSIIQSGISFSTDVKFGTMVLHLSVPQNKGQGYTLKLKKEVEVEDLALAMKNLFSKTILSAKVSLPDLLKVKIFGTKLKVQLSSFEILFSKAPKNKVNISLIARLPNAWTFLGNVSLATHVRDTSFRLKILSLNGNPVVTATIKGTIEVGNPRFLEYPFYMDIPHNVQPLSINLQTGKQLNIAFSSLLKAGRTYRVPNVVKRLLQNFNVTISKLELVFPPGKNKDPFIGTFEMKSKKNWDLKLIQLVDVSIKYSKNRHEISGRLEFLGLKLQGQMKWPPTVEPIVRTSGPWKLENLVRFCGRLSTHFINGTSLKLDMKGLGLIDITGVNIQSLDITLSQDLRKIKEVDIKIHFPKYSWKLFNKFFAVKNVIASIHIVVGKSFSMTMTCDMTLLDGALKIPFLIKVPLPSAETVLVKVFATKNEAAVVKLRDILVFLKSLVSIESPPSLADFLPQIAIEQFEVSFPKSLANVEKVILSARCLSSWDIGNRGILTVTNLHLNVSYKFYEVYGFVRIGRINLPVRYIVNKFQEPLFQLVKPITISNLAGFIATTFKQLLPKIKDIPNGNLLGLNNAIFRVQKVNIFFSRDLKSFIGFDIEVMIPKKWDFLRNFFSLRNVLFKLKVTDFSAAKYYYEFAISGIMEFFKNGKSVEFPLRCNIPSSSSSLIHLMLASPVNIELPDVLLIPLVQKIIPRELISPISDLLGPIRVDEISVHFKTQKPLQVRSFKMSVSALNVWSIPGLPVAFQNMTLKMFYKPSKVSALLSGLTIIKNYPINFEMSFPSTLNFAMIQFNFKEILDLKLSEMSQLLVPNFSIPSIFPIAFGQVHVKIEKFDLLLEPPLTSLRVYGFKTKFKVFQTVELLKDWLSITNVSVDMEAQFQGGIKVTGYINCLVRFGSTKDGFSIWSTLTMPSPPSKDWTIRMTPNSRTRLSLTKFASVFLRGIDIKSFFPSNILAKVTDIKLVELHVTFQSHPSPRIQRVKCLLETNLDDVWLPLKISIQKVQLDIDVLYKKAKSKPVVKSHLSVWIKVGKAIIQTTLSMKDNEFHLEIQKLEKQALNIFDLAKLVGGSQLRRVIPKPFMKFKEVTIDKLSLTFTKADFKIKDVYVLCNLNGFDAGFEFPILGTDNIFRTHLKVLTIELVSTNTWVLKAEIDVTISGLFAGIDNSLKDLRGVLTISPKVDYPTLELKKTIADISVRTTLAGIELALNIKVLNPKLAYSQSDSPEITVDLEVTGFDKLNDALPFDVFVNQLNMAVVIKKDKERPVGIRLKNLPIRDDIIPCKDQGDEEYKCDFTWLCNHDSYVYVKSPTLFYTKEGFEASVDVKGIDKLCIPITSKFLWTFIKNIPILREMFPKNIPLWPPPNLKNILRHSKFNINNLPKGMQHFIDPKFPRQIFTSVVVRQEGPLSLSIRIGNGESLKICSLNVHLMSGFVFREFTMGTAFGVPFINIDAEVYFWNLLTLMPLSHLPKNNPVIVNAKDLETYIICKDCFFVISGPIPVPIFASPFHLHYSTVIDASAHVTIYHKRPGFGEFGSIASLLTGLVKFYTDKDYLLSVKDFGGVQPSKDFLVVRFQHNDFKTMLQLPKVLGKAQLKLDIGEIDGKQFLIGFMNFFKTLNIKWLLQIVQLRHRIQNIDLKIGSMKFVSLQFAASTLNELKESKEWKQPVIGSGDSALMIASQKTPLNSLMLKIMSNGLVKAELSVTMAFTTGIIDIDLHGRTYVNLKDMSNPLIIEAKCRLDLFGKKLLAGQAIISLNKVAISGELNINFFDLLRLDGQVKAMVSSGEFRLSSQVNIRFVGVKLFDGSLLIRSGPRVSEVKVKARFLGSELAIELMRNGFSLKMIGRVKVNIGFNIDVGEIKVFGYSLGRFNLNAGVSVDIQIAFPGKSYFSGTFYFLGIELSTPKIGFNTEYARLDKLRDMVKDVVKETAIQHVKNTLVRLPLEFVKNVVRGFVEFGEQTLEIVGALAKGDFKSFAKGLGKIANNFAKNAKALAEKAIVVIKYAEKAAKVVRDIAEKAYKGAKKVVEKTLKTVAEVGKKFFKVTKEVTNVIRQVVNLGSHVERLASVVTNIARQVSRVANKIINIAKRIFEDIAKGIRDAAGAVIKTVRGWIGKRSIYRRNALNDEKNFYERQRRDLERRERTSRSQLQSKKRALNGAKKEASVKKTARKKIKIEVNAVNKNLDDANKDKNQKYAFVFDIYRKGKCVTGENDCHPKATCLRTGDDGQSFECLCKRGWIGDGRNCEMPIKKVAIMADKASYVGTAVTFVALTYSGTNVEYKFSFLDSYSASTYQSHVFSASGVYKVKVYARNPVNHAVDEMEVFIQEPVSNIRLMIQGDKGVCRPLELMALADGTNVTFGIDFGDKTTAINTTQKALHRYNVSGSYHINIIGKNLVSTLNKTFTVTIRNTHCDNLYCDLSRLELESKSLSAVANQAWQLAKSSNDHLPYGDPRVWKDLAVRNPLKIRIKHDRNTQNQMRIYDINGTTIDMSFVFASLLASTTKSNANNTSKSECGMIKKPVEKLMMEGIMVLSDSDVLNTWRVDMSQDNYFPKLVLEPSRIKGSIDGYILGASGIANNNSWKLSDIVYNYYCPNLENSKPLPCSSEKRYPTYLDLLRKTYPQENVTFLNYIKRFASEVIHGDDKPITADASLFYFARYVSAKLNILDESKDYEDSCVSWKSCSTCLSLGAMDNCSWCDKISKCIQEKDISTCEAARREKNLPCPDRCNQHSKCHECTKEPYCGWCGDTRTYSNGKCVEGDLTGPSKPSVCPKNRWHKNACDNSCHSNSESTCSGVGKCKLGMCVCNLGRYGKDCSKKGCVYRASFKDTADDIARRFNLTISDLAISNNHDKFSFGITANMLVTVPVSEINKLCLYYHQTKTFHPRFARLLRGSKNVINKESYCGLYGSLSDIKENELCKNEEREQCQMMPMCTWNAIDPCTGIIIEGCVLLKISTQILVPENSIIISPISGRVIIGKTFAKISGWPDSQWEHYVVTISLIRPKNITSIQAGNIIGLAALEWDPTLPKYFELALTYKDKYMNPEEHLLPCSPGCLQLHYLDNGICDPQCNVSSCNFDRGDCVVLTEFRSKLSLPIQLQNIVLTKKSWFVLSKLHEILRNTFIVKRGPMSVFALSKIIVLGLKRSQTISPGLLYDAGNHSTIIKKSFNDMERKNSTNSHLVVSTAKLIISFGIAEVSPYLAPVTNIQSFILSTKSLSKSRNFERSLEFLKKQKFLTYLRVPTSTNTTEYFHIEIFQREEETACSRHRYKADQTTQSCHALHSCFGHGVCNTHGHCVCDAEYKGIECKTSICPNNCSTHGTCVDGSCVCEHGWEGKDCSKIKLCTPSCLEIWIGDGNCDSNCNISRCNYDSNDCLNVCTCPKSWIGDGNCDHTCNKAECNYDEGDCLKKEECNPGCKPSMPGDGFCDRECNVEKCSFDKGDCKANETCPCDFLLQGNGVCDHECNKPSCMYDFGDCVAIKQVDKSCFQDCSPSMVGNGFCDLECNTSSCNFDGNDCIQKTKTDIQSACSPGCISSFLSDGFCDSICNVKACNFDGGDCPKPVVKMCNTGCNITMISDGTCQQECFVSQCSYDGKDCECAPGCHYTSLGNGICESQCLTESCLYDKNDCTCSPTNCPKEMIGDGVCNSQCNNRICNFDGGDCSCAPGCSVTSINDGWCDKECDVRKCKFDGIDCGGCKADSHLDVCDLNAECTFVNQSLPFLRCHCKAGFYGDGFECFKKGNCFNRSEICSQNAQCINISGASECSCNNGFTGNGMYCENIDECASNQHNCSVNAVCTDTNGSYSCDCTKGYSGNGFVCTDIDECIGNGSIHKCCANENCINTNGSYICNCGQGWEKGNQTESTKEHHRNDTTCKMSTNSPLLINENCIDVDECLEETDNCSRVNGSKNAKCVNTLGGFNCTCDVGYAGDGWFCTDVNECDFNDTCQDNQLCKNNPGSFTCLCKNGWIFNETGTETCDDINECDLGIHECHEYATCSNTNGSYTCACRKGFQDVGKMCTDYHCKNDTFFQNANLFNMTKGRQHSNSDDLCSCVGKYINTGKKCEDIDECDWGTYNCPAYASVCINTLGGYECECDIAGNSTCQVFNSCKNNTCHPNMTCVASGADHYCVCPSGYFEDPRGPEAGCVDRDECLNPEAYNCPNNAYCVNTIGSYKCRCRDGFFKTGGGCYEINECDATLVDRISGRLFECRPGICSSVRTCLYRERSSNSSRSLSQNTSSVCSCDPQNSEQLYCVEVSFKVEINYANKVTTALSFPWHTFFTKTNASSPIPLGFKHNCSESSSTCENIPGSYKCLCNPGYNSDKTGKNCYDDDECLHNHTCHANATCTNTIGSFVCSCKNGFTGDGENCSDVNECELGNFSCHANATCINVIGGYTCQCNHGYYGNGSFCEDVNECLNDILNNCHPRAVCSNYIGGYNCECTAGFKGDGVKCTDINECLNGSQLCSKRATCYNVPSSYICKCNRGWTGGGYSCTNIDECRLQMHSCVENSFCTDYDGGYICTCNKGWSRQWFEPYGRCSGCDSNKMCAGHGQCLRNGSCDCMSYYGGRDCSVCKPEVRCSGHGTCDFNGTCSCDYGWTRQPLDCSSCITQQLCSGFGRCNYDVATYSKKTCFCKEGYTGQNCNLACPIIDGEPCGVHGDCTTDHSSSHLCKCHTGYQWDNSVLSCVDVNECTDGSNECVTPAICVNTEGSYRCKCPSLVGWTYDGKSCKDINECQYKGVCDVHATCQNLPGEYRCICKLGYRGTGKHPICKDIDECVESSHKCPASATATCVNNKGSYYCVCKSGYEKVSAFQCVDINECSRGIHGCDRHSTCINTVGSWRCQCHNAWYPDPRNSRVPTCRDVNECADKPNACPAVSSCTNTPGSYHCTCSKGWANRGLHACVDINECNRRPCPSNSRCHNTQGSYTCYCNNGYSPRPPTHASTCNDINECLRGMYTCPSNSHCVNTAGGYRCDCNRCFHRNGGGCRADCKTIKHRLPYFKHVSYKSSYRTCSTKWFKKRCRTKYKQKFKMEMTVRVVVNIVPQRKGARCPC